MTIELDMHPGGSVGVTPTPITPNREYSRPDRIYRRGVQIAGLGVLAAIGFFLINKGFPAFRVAGLSFFTNSGFNTLGHKATFGVFASLIGTIEVATVAMIVGAPVAIATAIFLSEYAPRRSRRSLIALVDLAAAIPSIIFGLWAIFELQRNSGYYVQTHPRRKVRNTRFDDQRLAAVCAEMKSKMLDDLKLSPHRSG